MEITLRIPDDVAKRLSDAGREVSRRALETLALEGYRDQTLTLYQISECWGCHESGPKTSWDDIMCRYPRSRKRSCIARRHYSKRHGAARVSKFAA